MIANVTTDGDRLSDLLRRYDPHWTPQVRGLAADRAERAGLQRISGGDIAQRLALMTDAYRQQRDKLLGVIRYQLGRHGHGAAEDVLHEVMRKICQNPPDMRQPGGESAYLFAAVRREASAVGKKLDEERRQRDDASDALSQRADDHASFEDLTLFHLVLTRALLTLSPQERAVVELVDVKTLTIKKAAEQLGIAEGTAKKHRFVALRRLRQDPAILALVA